MIADDYWELQDPDSPEGGILEQTQSPREAYTKTLEEGEASGTYNYSKIKNSPTLCQINFSHQSPIY